MLEEEKVILGHVLLWRSRSNENESEAVLLGTFEEFSRPVLGLVVEDNVFDLVVASFHALMAIDTVMKLNTFSLVW